MEARIIKWNENLAAAIKNVNKCMELKKKLGLKVCCNFEDMVASSADMHCVEKEDVMDLMMGFASFDI